MEAMARLWDDSIEIDRVAEEISSVFNAANLRIHAFATFIPELLDKEIHRRRNARRALLFLSKLAKILRGQNHPVGTIEIVGGSIIEGVLPVKYKGQRCILANRKTTGAPEGSLLEELRDVARSLDADGTRLAIEIEPGPLFAFSTEAGVDGLVAQIEKLEAGGELPQSLVGLNLDVGHWMLCHISPLKLRETRIKGKIFSSHISDHSKCHTGDSIISSITKSEVFEEWISEINNLPKTSFSGLLSVEFECAKNSTSLSSAVDALLNLV